jgi:hypothetical protein
MREPPQRLTVLEVRKGERRKDGNGKGRREETRREETT